MNKKKKFQLKSKHLLFIMTFLCLSGILGSAADKMPGPRRSGKPQACDHPVSERN